MRSCSPGLVWTACVALVACADCKRSEPQHEPPPVEDASNSAHPTDQPEALVTVPQGLESEALFSDITEAAGIDFVHDPGASGHFYLPEEMGPGGAFLDFDNDGDLDIYLVQSGRIPGTDDGAIVGNRLYRNDGHATFVDVTEQSGTGDTGYGLGCACADYDNDGDVDIYVTNYGPNVLLRNDGDGRFVDVSTSAGVAHQGFGTSAVWIDYDRDGYLDLYVANYVTWRPADEGVCYSDSGIRDYCTPLTYRGPQVDVLYHNRGDGTFDDVSAAAGINSAAYNGLGVVAADFDDDGWEDIYVANDQHPNLLWINQHDGTFRDDALIAGCAVNAVGMPEASMGVAAEDVDGDGKIDLFMTHIRGETHTYFRNEGGYFEDVTDAMGLGSWNVLSTGFGTGFFDFDNDGRLDLFIANGAVNRASDPIRPENPYAEHDDLLHRQSDGGFQNTADRCGDLCRVIDMGRGAVFGDVDNDGDVDLLVANNRGPVRLFRNNNRSGHHWTMIRVLAARSGRDAIGARIEIQCGQRRWCRTVRRQYSYLSSSDPRVHFGLGTAARIDRMTIRWPTGRTEQWTDLPVDRLITVREGEAVLRHGWSPAP
ncbi:MAG: CRTAC1 family protein [Planctomycetes bacterium]|nr:CRTAC1 family protein [Planctomycetota bacterium]